MRQGSTLLEKAIEGVRTLALPACIKDSALRYYFVNDAYSRLMRRPAEDMIGWSSYQLTGIIDDREREDKERRAAVFGSEEAISCHIDGANERRRLHCERFITEDDAIYLYEIFEQQSRKIIDTDWQRREQDLLAAKAERDALIAEQESLLQSLPFGVLLLNAQRICEYVNDAFYALWDIDTQIDLKGQSYRTYLEHNFRHGTSDYGDLSFEEIYADRTKFFDSDQPNDTRELKTRNGKSLLISRHRLAGGRVLLTLTDVTESRQREATLSSLLERAEAADRAKSEFLTNMSHEIRTPMNGVLGMAELLSRSGLNARQKTFTDVIVKSANALLTIINDILDFSKLDAGELSLRHAPFQPSEAVEDAASLLIAQAQDNGVEMIVDIQPEALATVIGDAGRFRQIVINLIANAVKFTECGHILVELSIKGASEQPDATPELLLKVSDTGIGIAADDLEHIFEKFNQVGHQGAFRRHEGTGLGLSITAGLVALFGGTISATSTVNQGSCFTVALPTKIAALHRQSQLRRIDGTRASILTIGGSDIGHRILLNQLTNWGGDAHHAVDGEMGLAILREAESIGFQIDAVIIDQSSLAQDDLKVAQLIRQDAKLHNIGVIVIGVLNPNNLHQDRYEQSIDVMLSRPFRDMILQRALSELILEKRRGQPTFTPIATSTQSADSRPDILIAEDNEVNEIVFSRILQQAGLSFRIVTNGQDALEAWRRERPSLILMDIAMPQMDGFEATRHIRAQELAEGANCHVTIIGVSGHTYETERQQCLEAGMDDYLAKPISPNRLIERISNWMQQQLDAAEQPH